MNEFYYSDDDIEGDPVAKARRDEWRRGNSPAQKAALLKAKETLDYIRTHPGCTRLDMAEDGLSRPNFKLLIEHGLVYWVGDGVKGTATVTQKQKAQWYVRK